ncbi:alcohol dehydrogenase, propanol-preferring [Tistlia consotensis]|uniref:alcohol dehydrogenase n=1 Tax=Tistlia consotensis USBA 355 TaxID=560819 RepID=A0A1Y6BAY1_9PROT|nr:alcohol dehydrogenase catalytic domain-containing protein [Tistlia consotensis]SMF02110.1 alcohol dehydrogenase, propanol-preferring [Tistlia consotensis USBA 355]SNS26332.1 alcohol dehydrogenase, propanol-preferring [Tistlia consotensis]
MKAWVIDRLGPIDPDASEGPLALVERPLPEPGPGELRLKVAACGVCHTELDEIEGRTAPPRLPVVPGHEVVGRVDKAGPGAGRYAPGTRLGVGWIHRSCGGAHENLDPAFEATGRDADGGYAEYMLVPEAYAVPIPDTLDDVEAAPLLCAGAVGWRALKLTGLEDGQVLGLTGFGGSAHLVLPVVRHRFPKAKVMVFARDAEARAFALEQGADWAGATEQRPPEPCHAIIDTTPAWTPVVEALASLRPGGRLVINAIRKEEADKAALLRLSYAEHLWLEREIKTVANVTHADLTEFLALAGALKLAPTVERYPLARANEALRALRRGRIKGAKVLTVGDAR